MASSTLTIRPTAAHVFIGALLSYMVVDGLLRPVSAATLPGPGQVAAVRRLFLRAVGAH